MRSLNAARTLPPRLLSALRRAVPRGGLIYLPAAERANPNRARDAAIRRARAAGASISELARLYHLSESRIWKLSRGLHPDPRRTA